MTPKSKIALTKNQKKLIEKMGLTYEHTGMPPVTAKILALLLVAEDPDLTFDQIQTTLGVSKSATSTGINMLLNTGKIEEINKPGERKRYFRNRIVHWKEDIQKNNEHLAQLEALLKENLQQRPKSTVEFNNTLKELIDFVVFLQHELPILYKKWETGRKKKY